MGRTGKLDINLSLEKWAFTGVTVDKISVCYYLPINIFHTILNLAIKVIL